MAVGNDDALDVAFGTAQAVSDTRTADYDLEVSAATSAITIGGTPAAEDLVMFQIYRDVSEDDLAVDAKLIGIRLNLTIDNLNDS